MQSDNKEVIERKPGFNNLEMWNQCQILKDVVTQTIETKEGRGRNVRVYQKYKHNTPKEIIDRIIYSCEYYKNLHEMEKRKIGSLEVIKYKFEMIDDEPKIVIEMIKVLDERGAYIKFAKLKNVLDYLSKYPITFKEL